MLNLPKWGRGNFHAAEHWLAHLFDHTEREAASAHRPTETPNRKGRKRHPLEESDHEH